MTEVEMVGWPHQFDGHEFGQAPGVGNGTPLQYSCLGNPMEEEPGRLQPWGREELDMNERHQFHFSLSCIGEGNGNPLQCSCLENPRDWGSLVGCRLWGRTESDTTEAT